VRTQKARDVQKRLEREGWVWIRSAGSHRIFVHEERASHINVPWHRNGQDTLSPRIYYDIVKRAGWDR
jgi:predicted RNA binding protein YcfA (HicA-like mRNA interferase family)